MCLQQELSSTLGGQKRGSGVQQVPVCPPVSSFPLMQSPDVRHLRQFKGSDNSMYKCISTAYQHGSLLSTSVISKLLWSSQGQCFPPVGHKGHLLLPPCCHVTSEITNKVVITTRVSCSSPTSPQAMTVLLLSNLLQHQDSTWPTEPLFFLPSHFKLSSSPRSSNNSGHLFLYLSGMKSLCD